MPTETLEICNWTSRNLTLTDIHPASMSSFNFFQSMEPTWCQYPVIQYGPSGIDSVNDPATATYTIEGTNHSFKFKAGGTWYGNPLDPSSGQFNADFTVCLHPRIRSPRCGVTHLCSCRYNWCSRSMLVRHRDQRPIWDGMRASTLAFGLPSRTRRDTTISISITSAIESACYLTSFSLACRIMQ